MNCFVLKEHLCLNVVASIYSATEHNFIFNKISDWAKLVKKLQLNGKGFKTSD